MEEFLGIDRRYIHRELIPNNGYKELKNCDQIENQDGDRLHYIEEDESFVIVTDNPSEYLSRNQLYQTWRKL